MANPEHNVESVPAAELSPSLVRQIAELQSLAFPDSPRTMDERRQRIADLAPTDDTNNAQAPRLLIIRDGEQLLASASVFPRRISVGGELSTTLAMASVCTAPSHRGRYLGRAVVVAAFRLVDEQVFPHCLFQASETVRPFYEKLGAKIICNQIVNSLSAKPDANPFHLSVAMRYPADDVWGSAKIDLLGEGY